jgi:adenine phosphoribosyltransferase
LIKQMDANVVAACAVIDLPDLGGSDKLRAAGLEVFALCEYSGH